MSEEVDQVEVDRRTAFVRGLRQMADFLEAHDDLPIPHYEQYLNVWVYKKEEMAELVKGKGKWEKKAENTYMLFRKQFGPFCYDISIQRDKVCERVVVGTEVVPARPYQPERIVDKVEWKCAPILDYEVDEALGIDES